MIVAELLTDALVSLGVRRVWGVVGDALDPFVDAIAADDRLQWMPTHHEEAAAFAAGAEAQLTGQLAVCAGTVGPGALHLINGLQDANASRAPVLAITGQVPTSDIGTRFHQEVDLDPVFAPVTRFNHTVRSADQTERVLTIAVRTAVAERAATMITIPSDIMSAEVEPLTVAPGVRTGTVIPDAASIVDAVNLLDASERVTLMVGIGASAARPEVLELSERLAAPIVAALRGKETFEWDNPSYVGLTGLIGNQAATDAIEQADTLVMVGTDFPYREWLPQATRIIQIDTDATALGRRGPVSVAIHGDAAAAVRAIATGVADGRDRSHLDEARARWDTAVTRRAQLADGSGLIGTAYAAFINLKDGRLHPELVATTIGRLMDDDAVASADVGLSTVWAARFLDLGPEQRLLGSFNHGSMANALPQALGAQAVDRNRQVLSLSGDGGLMMLLGELRTAVTCGLAIKVIVFNNRSLGLVELEEAEAGIPPTGTTLDNPDFAQVGRALGLTGFQITDADELEPTLRAALAEPGPVIVDVHTSSAAVSIPPSPSASQAWGFAVATVKDLVSRD